MFYFFPEDFRASMMAVRGKDGRFYYILKEFSYDAFDKSGTTLTLYIYSQ